MPVPREGDLATIGGLAVAAARAIFTATRLNSARDLLIFFYAGRYKHVVIRYVISKNGIALRSHIIIKPVLLL